MKTVKFRGRRIDNNEWVYGSLDLTDNKAIISWNKTDEEGDKAVWFANVQSSTIGQYICLNDKNGKEIYEGDIVQYYDDTEDEVCAGVVEYTPEYCSYGIKEKNMTVGINAIWEYEVIDNIHNIDYI